MCPESELRQVLEKIIQNLKDNPPSSERAVEFQVIMPLLNALHWDCLNTQMVIPQYEVGSGRVDLALVHEGKALVLIEVKSLGIKLDDFGQIVRYAFEESADLAVFTNGESWLLFLPKETDRRWRDRQFLKIHLLDQKTEDIEQSFSDFLSFESVTTGITVRKAKELLKARYRDNIIENTFPKAVEAILDEPDELFIELVANQCENLCRFRPTNEETKTFIQKYFSDRLDSHLILEKVGKGKSRGTRQSRYPTNISTGNVVGKKPRRVRVMNEWIAVRTWKDVKIETFNQLLKKYPNNDLAGRATDKRRGVAPHRLNRGKYTDVNLGSPVICKHCLEAVAACGLNPKTDWEIEIG